MIPDPDFNPPDQRPTPNEFVLVFLRDDISKPVVGFYDGYGNWKRLVFSGYDFEWCPEQLPPILGWKPII